MVCKLVRASCAASTPLAALRLLAVAPSEPTDHNQWLARTWSQSVRSEVNFRVRWWQKLTAVFNPRPLFGSRRRPKHGPSWTIGP